MKKIILLFILCLPFTLFATSTLLDEIGGNIGVTSIHNETGLKLQNFTVGMNYQINNFEPLKPRFDFDYVNIGDFEGIDSLLKGSVNGVYEHENYALLNPYLFGGLGYEYVGGKKNRFFESNFFIQGGVGLAYDIGHGSQFKLEGKVSQIVGGNDEGSEVMFVIGVTFLLEEHRVRETSRFNHSYRSQYRRN